MEIRQHIPAFVDGIDPGRARFASRAELLAIPWVESWARDPGFHRFSLSVYNQETTLLMAESEDGAKWHVVGYLDAPDAHMLDLPKWVHPKAEMPVNPPPPARAN